MQLILLFLNKVILPGFILFAFQSNAQDSSHIKAPLNFDSLFLAKQKESIGKSFPLFTCSFEDKVFTNENLKGKIVFINFWFEACPPCIAELDALNELFDRLKDTTNFEFISFTYESRETIKRLVKKNKIHYKVFSIKQQECYRLNQNNGFPTSIILDTNGKIIFLKSGGSTDKKVARKTILDEYYTKILNELN